MTDQRVWGDANPLQAFMKRLHALHVFAGKPSMRELARDSGRIDGGAAISASTVHKALNSGRLPRWATARTLVRLMGGDESEFHGLWIAASIHIQGTAPTPADRDRTAPDVSDSPPPQPQPRRSGEVVTLGKAGRELATRRSLYQYWPDAPPVIDLLRAGIRDSRDLRDLLAQVVFHDPRGASPAVALIAENDPDQALEIMASLARRESARAVDLLRDMAVAQPQLAAGIITRLLSQAGIEPVWLLDPSLLLAEVAGYTTLAAKVLGLVLRQGDIEGVPAQLCEWAAPTATRLGQMLALVLSAPSLQAPCCRLLDEMYDIEQALTADVFLYAVYDTVKQVPRSDGATRLTITVVVRSCRNAPGLFLTCVSRRSRQEGTTGIHILGNLLLDLAGDDLPVAARLTCTLALRRPKNIMRILSHLADRRQDVANLLLAVAKVDPKIAATVMAHWLGARYPAVPVAIGWVVRCMAGDDPSCTAQVLTMAAEQIPATPTADRSSLAGLDRAGKNEIMAAINPHVTYQASRRIRALL